MSSGDGRGKDFALDVAVLLVKGTVSMLVWLLVSKWRVTFPLHVVIALLAIAAVINSSLVTQGWTAVLIVALLAGLIVALVSKSAPFRENRMFGYAAAGLGAGWLMLTRFAQLSGETLFQVLGVLLVVLGALWAMDFRNNTTVKITDELRSWHENPERQARAGVKDLQVIEHEDTDYGYRRRLGWPGNTNSIDQVIKQTRAIEAEWGELEGTLVIERVPDPGGTGRFLSNEVEARCIRHDPLSEPVLWDGKPVENLTDWVQIGVYADGRPMMFRLWENGIGGFHLLAAGAPRSGKSVLLQLLGLLYGPHPFVRSMFVDFKGGTAFKPIAPVGTWLVDNIPEAIRLLWLLYVECERRSHLVAKNGWPNGVWVPSAEDPVLLAYFDEIASLTGDGVDKSIRNVALFLLSEIGRKGPGLGVLLRVGTQEPTKQALGTTQFINQLQWRAVFRLNVANRMHFVMPNFAGQVDSANIRETARGTCYVDAGGTRRAMEVRMRWVPDWMMRRVVTEFWHHEIEGNPRPLPTFSSPQLPPGAQIEEQDHWAALEAFHARTQWTPDMARQEPTGDEPSADDEWGRVDPPRRSPRAPKPGVGVPPEDVDPFGYAAIGDDEEPEQIESGRRSSAEYIAAAAEHPKSSREARAFVLEAVKALLHEQAGEYGLRRKKIQDAVGRSPAWTSEALAELAEKGLVHAVGPKGNAYWFPGPDPSWGGDQGTPERELPPGDDEDETDDEGDE